MREFIRTYGKLAGLFAAAALLLSFLTGMLARNPVGAVVFRAVFFAVVFCGLAIGLQFIVRRFLPELSGPAPSSPEERSPGSEDMRPRSAQVVDIVLPEENPLVAAAGDPARELMDGEPGAADLGEMRAEGAPDGGLEDAAGLEMPGEAQPSGVRSGAAEAVEGENAPRATGLGTLEGLDGLPDIDGMESAGRRPGRARAPRTTVSGAAADEARRSLSEDEDPSTLARAVRTVLKRDEKG